MYDRHTKNFFSANLLRYRCCEPMKGKLSKDIGIEPMREKVPQQSLLLKKKQGKEKLRGQINL